MDFFSAQNHAVLGVIRSPEKVEYDPETPGLGMFSVGSIHELTPPKKRA